MKRVILISIIGALGVTANAADYRPSPSPTPHPIERPMPQIPSQPQGPWIRVAPTGPSSGVIVGGKGEIWGGVSVAPGQVHGTVTFPTDIGGR